jgi:hypothetical protein
MWPAGTITANAAPPPTPDPDKCTVGGVLVEYKPPSSTPILAIVYVENKFDEL